MFRFKEFWVEDSKSTMKVGTDAILLGTLTSTIKTKNILEIGTGCGVIALLCAQRSNADVYAIDIDADSVQQANTNFKNSKWKDRLFAESSPLQNFWIDKKECFDLIVSNPPFFSNGIKSLNSKRNFARHNDKLNFDELVLNSSRLLKKNGKLSLIITYDSLNELLKSANKNSFFLNKIILVFPKSNKTVSRCIVELSRKKLNLIKFKHLTIRNSDNSYTKEYLSHVKQYQCINV